MKGGMVNALRQSALARDALRLVVSAGYVGRHVAKGAEAADVVSAAVRSRKPHAIGKLGSVETLAIRKYLRTAGRRDAVAVTAGSRESLYTNAGVFPNNYDTYAAFCRHLLDDVLPQITVMGVWYNLGEASIVRQHCPRAHLTDIYALEPYLHQASWWHEIADRHILVVHPFAATIESQCGKMRDVWPGHDIPTFHVTCLSVPLSPVMATPSYSDWFATLEALKREMARRAWDLAVIGAGAYSLPLAVHARALGRQALHLGGATQVMFGIIGKRWEAQPAFRAMLNEHWVRPSADETPIASRAVENGCYW